ncbi:hypothetical protein C8Q73DRAFT_788764 [Cubamyces lactineus]|nr:hypothetical protein C8Q73DRAFT_788764 [Cubamyces lactineus]
MRLTVWGVLNAPDVLGELEVFNFVSEAPVPPDEVPVAFVPLLPADAHGAIPGSEQSAGATSRSPLPSPSILLPLAATPRDASRLHTFAKPFARERSSSRAHPWSRIHLLDLADVSRPPTDCIVRRKPRGMAPYHARGSTEPIGGRGEAAYAPL